MIVVLLGTNPYSFFRLVRPLDELTHKNGWDVFIQIGNTDYQPKYMRFSDFIPRNKLMEIISEAEIVLCQGGFGSIRDALVYNKPIVAVPRLPELGESPDTQEELVRALEEAGYVIGVYDIKDLELAIEKARSFKPTPREQSCIPKIIGEYLDEQIT